MVPFKRAMAVSYRLSIVTIALSLAAICHRMSAALKPTGEWVTLGQSLERKG